MTLFDVLEEVSAIEDCKVADINSDQGLIDALSDGYVNCIDGKLTLTKEGADVYRGMRDSRSGG